MVNMRESQFTEGVMRSLNMTASYLERQETLHYLEEDVNIIESSLYDNYDTNNEGNLKYSIEGPDGIVTDYTLKSETHANPGEDNSMIMPMQIPSVGSRYGAMQEVIRSQYLYQKGLLNEVILSILRDAGSRPAIERADSVLIRKCLTNELANNGVKTPFTFALLDNHDNMIYSTTGYAASGTGIYSIPIFSNTDTSYKLNVEFPDKAKYIFSSVRFIIPTLAFTLILMVVFVYTLVLAFRQKNLAEMKTDFINNMTHELKTPISTISLAGQMLSDPAVTKSPTTLSHLAEVITDESKRLRFQVEKVLQLSVLDKTGSTLKFTEVNANGIINGVVNTFKLKVEKQGGTIVTHLDAEDAEINVDEMQFTNVIFNLLDNALKYMKDDIAPALIIKTKDIANNRIEIRVIDNGIGIKKEDVKRIFEKFYRVSTGNRHDVKGFGLGLAYVKRMVDAFGGTIMVESEYGKGSEFVITLPLIE